MMSQNNGQEKVLVIIGPTGSGKTGLAIEFARELAKRRGVECAAGHYEGTSGLAQFDLQA